MEKLKQWIRDNFIFDKRYTFEENLKSNLDNRFIYYSKCKEFYDLDSLACFKVACMEGFEPNPEEDDIHNITDIAREAAQNLVYNYMYSELEKLYEGLEE